MSPLPFQYAGDEPAAPVQFVSPGQGYYNPPPNSQAYRNTMAHVAVPDTPTKSPSQPDKAAIRPLSVDEALQFSPLCSILPFDMGMIPMPNASIAVSRSAFASTEDKRKGNQKLHALNQEMVQPSAASAGSARPANVPQTIETMQSLLALKEIPVYEFKTPPSRAGAAAGELPVPVSKETPAAPAPVPVPVPVPVPRLSPFAKLLVDKYKVPFRIGPAPPSPGSAPTFRPGSSQQGQGKKSQQSTAAARKASKTHTSTAQNKRASSAVPAVPAVPASPHLQQGEAKVSQTPSPHLQPDQILQQTNKTKTKTEPSFTASVQLPPGRSDFQNTSQHDLQPPIAEVKMEEPLTVAPLDTTLSSNGATFQVVIDTKHEDRFYTPPPDPDHKYQAASPSAVQILLPSKTSLTEFETRALKPGQLDTETVLSDKTDQKAIADANIKDLRDTISEVLETEAEAQASGLSSSSEGVITTAAGADGDVLVLSSGVLLRLDGLFRKVIERRRITDIDIDSILQLQKICERSLSCTDNLQISLSSDWPALDEASRNKEASFCQQTLQAARLILRTMTSGQADKQILSEELLHQSLSLLNKVVDNIVLPTVEARSTGSDTKLYNTATECKKQITQILHECNKLMQLLLQILSREEVSETAVNQVEYFAIRMLFVENSPTEKDSILGIVKFESFRRLAMLVLVEIFSRYQEQRQFIIGEVLTSLQKLPTARQHGRQFKLEGGKRMQLVTVLLVRLVQASGVNTVAKSTRTLLKAEANSAGDEDGSDSEGEEDEHPIKPLDQDSEDEMEDDDQLIPRKLIKNVRNLHDASINTAWHIVSFLVQKALTASKSGEQPHRHLLDIFIEDLIVVLGLPEWPGAELLLQLLVNKMKELAESTKTNAPMKTMALETLGTLGTAILDVTFEAQGVARSLDTDGSSISLKLIEQFESNIQGQLSDLDVCNWQGPFRLVMDHSEQNDTHGRTNSAQGFLLTKWAKTLLWGAKSTNNEIDDERIQGGARNLSISLAKMTITGKWDDPEPLETSNPQARLAYLVTILHLGFCQSFPFILSLLMASITSEHITVRARSLKSVTQMLEKDPGLLDRHRSVIGLILKCTSDPSASVKDSSLALLGKCITLRPSIEREVIQAIINASTDQTVGIRKRALRLLRDAYLREDANAYQWRTTVKSLAVNSIFSRTGDEEESVVEISQQIFEEIWMDPFRSIVESDKVSSSGNILLKEQMALIIQCLREHDNLSKSLEQLVRYSLSSKGKASDSSRKICKALVACAFDGIIDSTDLPGAPAQHEILQALTVFARTDPKLFTAEHVELLKPYVSCLSNGDDLNLFRGVVAIFRSVLPTLPTVQQESLRKIQNDLQSSVPKLPKAELDEVASCLWTICKVLKNPERLVKLTISCLQNLQKLQTQADMSDALVQKVQRLIRIAGHFGKYCDFQPQLAIFNSQLPNLKGDLVAGKVVAGIQPYTSMVRPLTCRAVAWEGIGMVCQSWPRTFNIRNVSNDIQKILEGDETELQTIVLTSIRDFFMSQDQSHDTEANALSKDPLAKGKLGGSMTATDNDGAAALIAQAYLKHILHIALNSNSPIALVATEVVSAISRQGLVHPKEVGPAMVALATSPNQKVVNVALQQLQSLHSQHETLFEREYMRAVHQAFVYQRDIVGNTSGYVDQPARAKLQHVYEVIKSSKAKFVHKFLTNICGRLDFDLTKLDTSAEIPSHLQYTRFLIENLVFFDFSRLEDVNHVIACLERCVAATGSAVAHAINTELLQVTVDNVLGNAAAEPEQEPDFDLDDGTLGGFLPEPVLDSIEEPMATIPEAKPGVPELDPARLRQLTTAAVTLTMIWETRTFLRKLYNINAHTHKQGKSKNAKDPNRAPIRSNFVSSEKFLELLSSLVKALESQESSQEQCRKFADLMSIDDELKVANGDDEEADGDVDTFGLEDLTTESRERGIKRKGSMSSAGTPKKRQRSKQRRSMGGDSRGGSPDMDDWLND